MRDALAHNRRMNALDGIRILDCSRVLAGPWCTQTLADLGADVVKVERPRSDRHPGGDDTRGWGPPFLRGRDGQDTAEAAYYLGANRNKRSITCDLSSPAGQALIRELALKADVFVENYKVGDMARYGLDYASLSAINPRLVYCSITGFGQTGPYKDRAGYDYAIQGMGGLMSVTGKPEDGPMRVGIPIADLCSGHFCAQAIMAALLEREVSGEGQWVQTSLLESQIAMLDFQAAQWLIDHKVPKSTGNEHPLTVPTGVFQTRDGYINLAAIGNNMFKRLCVALEIPVLIDQPGFGSDPERVRNRERVNAAVGTAFRQRSTAEWTEILLKAGVPCGPIYTVDRMFEDPQVKHLGIARTLQHPELGDIEVVGLPMNFSRYPRQDGPLKAAPAQGDQTGQILGELGYSAERIAELRSRCVV